MKKMLVINNLEIANIILGLILLYVNENNLLVSEINCRLVVNIMSK